MSASTSYLGGKMFKQVPSGCVIIHGTYTFINLSNKDKVEVKYFQVVFFLFCLGGGFVCLLLFLVGFVIS